MPIQKQEKNEQRYETKWDEAIADAKEKIKRLRYSIAVYEQRKLVGDRWPDKKMVSHG